MNAIITFLSFIGRSSLTKVGSLGLNVEKSIVSTYEIITPPYYYKNFLNSILDIGFYSLPLVALTSIFTGIVLVLQTYTSFTVFGSQDLVSKVLVVSLCRELAPVLTSLMVIGRVSSSISAEIATMKVTEQISALYTLSVNSKKFLVAPKVFAGLICLPFLVLISDILGVMGGYLVGVFKLNFNGLAYITSSYNFITFYDVFSGLVKGAVFGLILTTVACYCGYQAKNGASGVGKATTSAVVISSILVFILDYILTIMFFGIR